MKIPEELMFFKNGRSKQKSTDERLDGKTTIISGATSGIGYATAKRLAKFGSNIVIVARNEEKAIKVQQELSTYGVEVNYYIADFADFESVRYAAERINKEIPEVDYLINSAGLHSTKKRINQFGIEQVFSVNHLGTFLFTVLLLNKLNQKPSRIIQVNSEGHRFNGLNVNDINFEKRLYTGLRSYGQSKTAQLMTVAKLSERLQNSNITINCMHPGAVKTNIGNNNGILYRTFLKYVLGLFLKDVEHSASALHYLMLSDELEESNKFYNLTIPEIPAKHVFNKEVTQAVWELSLKLTSLEESEVLQ